MLLILDLIVIGFLSFRGIKTFSSSQPSPPPPLPNQPKWHLIFVIMAQFSILWELLPMCCRHQGGKVSYTKVCCLSKLGPGDAKKEKKIREILWNYSWILVIWVPSLIVAIFFRNFDYKMPALLLHYHHHAFILFRRDSLMKNLATFETFKRFWMYIFR